MKTINNIILGDLVVSEEICLAGVVTGSITVTATGKLELRGICSKNLVIEKGGWAKIYGVRQRRCIEPWWRAFDNRFRQR